MPNSPVDHLASALDGYERVLAGIGADQWAAPTPCAEWTVRDVANHVHNGNLHFTSVVRGEPDGPWRKQPATDLLGSAPVGAFREAADAMLTAFGRPGVFERLVVVPMGEVPGIAALYLRVVEHLVHGWDLARATGQRPAFDDQLVKQAYAFTEEKLAELPPGSTAFAPPAAVADDATPLDRLAALLGR